MIKESATLLFSQLVQLLLNYSMMSLRENYSFAGYDANRSTAFVSSPYNGSLRLNGLSDADIHDRVTLGLRIPIDLIGTFGNCLLLAACYKQQKIRQSAIGLLIMELVMCWLFTCTVSYKWGDVGRVIMLTTGRTFGKWYCIARIELNMTSAVCVNCIDACLAINRFVAICLPMHYKLVNTRKSFFIMNVFTVAISLTMLLPAMGIAGRFTNIGLTECAFITESHLDRAISNATQMIPLSVIGIFGSLTVMRAIFLAVRHRRKTEVTAGRTDRTDVQMRQRKTMQRRIHLSAILFASYMFSLVCGLPYWIVNSHFRSVYVKYPNLSPWINLLYHGPFPVCPIIMICMSRDYTMAVRAMIPACLKFGSCHRDARKPSARGRSKTDPVPLNSMTTPGSDMQV